MINFVRSILKIIIYSINSGSPYVIMPNHLHCILFFPTQGFSLNKIVSNAKRFMAYELIRRLKENNQTDILQQVMHFVPVQYEELE